MTASQHAFHLPGKHNQKRHGNRYKDGVQVKGVDKAGKPIKMPSTSTAPAKPKPKPKKATKPKTSVNPSSSTKTDVTNTRQPTRSTPSPEPAKATQPAPDTQPTVQPQSRPETESSSKPEGPIENVHYASMVEEYRERLSDLTQYGTRRSTVTYNQADALDVYTDDGYRAIQKSLRRAKDDPSKVSKSAAKYTKEINDLIDQAGPSDRRYQLYRGIGDITISLGTTSPQPGMRFRDYGFGSTSAAESVARQFAVSEQDHASPITKHVIMLIDAPEGTRMLPVRAVNRPNSTQPVGYQNEREVLLPNGVEYEVTRFVETEGKNAANELYVRIVSDSGPITAAARSFEEREEDYDRRLNANGDETKGSPVFFIISEPDDDDDDNDEGDEEVIVLGGSALEGATVEEDDINVDEGAPVTVDDSRFVSWSGVIAVEGVKTGDGRQFEHGALTWADLPMPLGWMYERSHGGMPTDKVVNVGMIDTIERGEGGIIVATGRIDLRTERGWEVASMMGTREEPGSLAGISIDADDPDRGEVEYVFPDACNLEDESDVLDMQCMMPELVIFHSGRIRAATLVDIPAFVEARIFLDESLDDVDEGELHDVEPVEDPDDVLVAASYTMTLSDLPPAAWFDEPTEEPDIGAITVTDQGRIFGYLAPSHVAHRGIRDKRVTVPMGNVDYGIWMNRVTIVDDGQGGFTRIATGPITMDCGHAPMSNRVTGQARRDHYDNSCSVVATARVGENSRGVWIAGAILPDVTPEQIRRMMALQLSGDWGPHREKPGKRELAGALLVPVPGFPKRSFSTVIIKNGAIERVGVPLRFAVTSHHDDERVFGGRAAVERIARSIGRDRRSRMQELAERVRRG